MKIIKNIIKNTSPSAIALGNFDGLHKGHMSVINSVLTTKNLSKCVFTFENLSSPDMLLTEKSKHSLLSKIGIDYCFSPPFSYFKNFSPEYFVEEILIKTLNVKFLSCGSNYRFGNNASGNIDTLKALCNKHNIYLHVSPDITYNNQIISSSKIRQYIKAGNILNANNMLGYDFFISFKVVFGRKIGRKIGVPTINQIPLKHSIPPKFGVYSTYITLNGKDYPSLTNFGIKPTFGNFDPVYETWIFDIEQDLYDTFTPVHFLDYLREEKTFDSVNDLKQQILKDKALSLNIFQHKKQQK